MPPYLLKSFPLTEMLTSVTETDVGSHPRPRRGRPRRLGHGPQLELLACPAAEPRRQAGGVMTEAAALSPLWACPFWG